MHNLFYLFAFRTGTVNLITLKGKTLDALLRNRIEFVLHFENKALVRVSAV